MSLNLIDHLLQTDTDPNFLPCPAISLSVDPNAGTCGICQDTPLILENARSPTITYHTSRLAILPCGHIACNACLKRCLQSKPECPFCRMNFKYEMCSHPMLPRVVTKENLFSLPDTVPMGGKIPNKCRDCCAPTDYAVKKALAEVYAQTIKKMREEYGRRDEDGKKEMSDLTKTVSWGIIYHQRLSGENIPAPEARW